MPGIPQIRSIEFLQKPEGGRAQILVRLEDGSSSSFAVSTPSEPAAALEAGGRGFFFGRPVLFVASLDEASIGEAVNALAADIGGFWLRYYNTPGASKDIAEKKTPRPVTVDLTEREGRAERCSANVQVHLDDGRQFSILAATASWFEQAFKKAGLRYYFGPAVLFLGRMELALAKKAAQEMARRGDQWLCSYDTPRTTLSRVLADFKAKHP